MRELSTLSCSSPLTSSVQWFGLSLSQDAVYRYRMAKYELRYTIESDMQLRFLRSVWPSGDEMPQGKGCFRKVPLEIRLRGPSAERLRRWEAQLVSVESFSKAVSWGNIETQCTILSLRGNPGKCTNFPMGFLKTIGIYVRIPL